MSRRKSKARKGIGLHTPTEPESAKVDITSSKITTAYGPEEDLESAFAENLRIMFDPPQSEDTVWKEVCSMMLKKKLFAQNTEVKKKLVKSIEKKAGIKA
ncbi:hypothetical protein Tco_0030714 [Tanacetum coccineum]